MLQLYGLMHVADPAVLATDPASPAPQKVDVYLRNAATLAASARVADMPFRLVSNAPEWLEARLAGLGLAGAAEVIAGAFAREVPGGIPFQAAHYKLDLLSMFGTGALGEQVALVDLDMVVQRKFALPDPDALYVYDIWDHVASAFGDVLSRDLGKFDVPAGNHRWYGGEFIAGSPANFAVLSAEIEAIWPHYLAALGTTHHTGDEMVVTSALLRLAARGFPLREAGSLGFVQRWWSARTRTRIQPLARSLDAAMLHLPADKDYLAARAGAPFDVAGFPDHYRRHARGRRHLAMVKNVVDVMRGRRAQYLPQLA
ncbi:hypothetical protein [Novosphingobium huizhouense]|uniref:hypothetical protein n=1 Tax=Novosphingobium huizhouense TaxID=2866625 RepID=UPI001CD8C1B4|nr:hypothetical protein [Novosphingobium huizhouense]